MYPVLSVTIRPSASGTDALANMATALAALIVSPRLLLARYMQAWGAYSNERMRRALGLKNDLILRQLESILSGDPEVFAPVHVGQHRGWRCRDLGEFLGRSVDRQVRRRVMPHEGIERIRHVARELD